MIATWPSDLPRPLRETYADAYDDLRIKRRSDSGVRSYRKRVSISIKTLNVSIAVTEAKLGVFETFVEETLQGGVLPFWMADPVEDGQPILLVDGSPLLDTSNQPILATVNRLYTFGETLPGKVPHGIGYKISFTLSEIPL